MRCRMSSIIPPIIAARATPSAPLPRMHRDSCGSDVIRFYECDVDPSHPYQVCSQRGEPDATGSHCWLSAFRDCFTAPVWNHVLVLVAGAVLAPGKRTVSQALRVMGLAAKPGFARYHEVLSRARWDGRAVTHKLLAQVLDAFLPAGEWSALAVAHGHGADPLGRPALGVAI